MLTKRARLRCLKFLTLIIFFERQANVFGQLGDIAVEKIARISPGFLALEFNADRYAERLLKKRAEDRGIDLAPVLRGGLQQLADFLALKREGRGPFEQIAVVPLHHLLRGRGRPPLRPPAQARRSGPRRCLSLQRGIGPDDRLGHRLRPTGDRHRQFPRRAAAGVRPY